VENYFMLF